MLHNLEQMKQIIDKISDQNKSDIFLFCGNISDYTVDTFIDLIRDKQDKKANCSLILTTLGGDPDAGYRLTKSIKRHYEKFILYVFGHCKSTGTLIALGSDEIIMSDFSELGPLDIQLTKDDELSNTSGLNYMQSLTSLNDQIFASFEENFLSLKQRSGFTITTKTAAEIASTLAVGLLSPISAQLDPVKLGEVQRSITIAESYGSRLCEDKRIIMRLIAGYPSHGFVIDFEEAKGIFPNVRFVNQEEGLLERILFKLVRNESREPKIIDLIKELSKENEENVDDSSEKDLVLSHKDIEKQNGNSKRDRKK